MEFKNIRIMLLRIVQVCCIIVLFDTSSFSYVHLQYTFIVLVTALYYSWH